MVKFKIHDVTTWLTNNYNNINISRSEGNQTMELGQLIEYNKKNILLQKYAQSGAGRLISDLFLFF